MRIREHGVHYHAIARCNNGERLLSDDYDCSRLMEYLKYYVDLHECQLFNFVIMPSHVHLLLMTDGGSLIDDFMHDWCLAFSHDYNKRNGRSGHFWKQKYRSKIVMSDMYALVCLRYIDKNPVAAGLVKDPAKWPWSGFSFYADGAPCEILTKHPSYLLMGHNDSERQEAYRAMFENMDIKEKDEITLFESFSRGNSTRYNAASRRVIKTTSSFLSRK